MTASAKIAVGDIVLVSFPFSDASAAKSRPALVMSECDAYGDALMAAITSNPHTPDGIELAAADLSQGSLKVRSWVKPHKVTPVEAARVVRVLARAKPQVLAAVRASLCPALGCC